MYFGIFLAQYPMYCPKWLRLLGQHYLPWCRREFVPVRAIRELRALLLGCGLRSDGSLVFVSPDYSGGSITVSRIGRYFFVLTMNDEFDGTGVQLAAEYYVRSSHAPVVRRLCGTCDGVRDTTGRRGAGRSIWRFPPALVYADEDDLRGLIACLRTWQKERVE